MPISECSNIGVVCCEPDTTIPQLAALMRKHHVGDVVVVEHNDDVRMPLGIVTDRDIVIETIAVELDAPIFTAGDIMSTPLVTVRENEGFIETLRQMRQHGVRRMPVVTENGALAGIVTIDDIVKLLTLELSMMSSMIAEQPLQEGRLRR